jgi:methionyl-tRNA formyltransferase
MSKENFKIVFMGTPEFSVTILEGILETNYELAAVVTNLDKPSGRGQKINQSAVKIFCENKGIATLQPTSLKDPAFISELKAINADLFVVVAFRMLPEVVWGMPKHGTINLHASLLPNYRGAAPINWAIINGEKMTGVTTFFIEKEIDTGMIIERQEVPISENETAGELHDELMLVGKELVKKTIHQISTNNIQRIPQSNLITEELKSAPKIFKDDCQINWKQNSNNIHNFIRGLSPYPAAWTELVNTTKNESKTYKIFKSFVTEIPSKRDDLILFSKEGLLFPCLDTYVLVTEIQPEGKKRMNFKEFSAGYSNFEFQLK